MLAKNIPSFAVFLCLMNTDPALGQSLHGSKESVERAYQEALDHDYTFLATMVQMRRFVRLGLLVRLAGNQSYEVDEDVVLPYVRPETWMFVERLSAQSVCSEKTVVTGALRLTTDPPLSNASALSVHPTGMAVDLRIPLDARCRRWFENTLLFLEGKGVLDVTREFYPPHYHVVIFSRQYASYVASRNPPQSTLP